MSSLPAVTPAQRRGSLVFALAVAVCLIAAKPPEVVGDGGEYLVLSLNFSRFHGPSIAHRDLAVLRQEVVDYAPTLEPGDFYRNAVVGRGGRRDFMHFWFMSFLATPAMWLVKAVGLPAAYAFAILNVTLLLLALWVALPRLGRSACLLLFASPMLWWIDKAHPEAMTFSLLTITIVLAREKPWWAMVAAAVASTQYPPLLAVVALVFCISLANDWSLLRDRRFVRGSAAAAVIGLLHPLYNLYRIGTPSSLVNVVNTGWPSVAEFTTVLFDPSLGLFANFPALALVLVGAFAVVLRRDPKQLASRQVLLVCMAAALFLVLFAQKDNVHHGATPSLTRYAVWFIPLTIPFLMAASSAGRAGWRAFLAVTATLSAVGSVFAFHPSVGQNSREPTWLASYLWKSHPAWSNPLPEVFGEIMHRTDDAFAPVATPGCEKVLLGGSSGFGMWPIPCFPAPVPGYCLVPHLWCYANRAGESYGFVKAPGLWNRTPSLQPEWMWPLQAEPHVRAFYTQWGWSTLTINPPNIPGLRASRGVQSSAMAGSDRVVLVLRNANPGATLLFRWEHPMTGVIVDPMTGQVIKELNFDGPGFDQWEIAVPEKKLMLLGLRKK